MADGPAGLRLQRVSAVTRSGKVKGVEPAMSAMKYFPKVMTGFSLGNPEKQPCIYQFATSFPAGLSLAQSWNLPLAEAVGEAVGKEMEAYGVTACSRQDFPPPAGCPGEQMVFKVLGALLPACLLYTSRCV